MVIFYEKLKTYNEIQLTKKNRLKQSNNEKSSTLPCIIINNRSYTWIKYKSSVVKWRNMIIGENCSPIFLFKCDQQQQNSRWQSTDQPKIVLRSSYNYLYINLGLYYFQRTSKQDTQSKSHLTLTNIIWFSVTFLMCIFCNSCLCLFPRWRNKIYSFIYYHTSTS